jgi:hypothetical protein
MTIKDYTQARAGKINKIDEVFNYFWLIGMITEKEKKNLDLPEDKVKVLDFKTYDKSKIKRGDTLVNSMTTETYIVLNKPTIVKVKNKESVMYRVFNLTCNKPTMISTISGAVNFDTICVIKKVKELPKESFDDKVTNDCKVCNEKNKDNSTCNFDTTKNLETTLSKDARGQDNLQAIYKETQKQIMIGILSIILSVLFILLSIYLITLVK